MKGELTKPQIGARCPALTVSNQRPTQALGTAHAL